MVPVVLVCDGGATNPLCDGLLGVEGNKPLQPARSVAARETRINRGRRIIYFILRIQLRHGNFGLRYASNLGWRVTSTVEIFMHRAILLAGVILICARLGLAQELPAVHEWGTFTSLQDEDGRTIGGINSEEETLPKFVHDQVRDGPEKVGSTSKGLPLYFPSVTMRLEMPVVYFHPVEGKPMPATDVSVEFHGGLLTQFYPDAQGPTLKFTGSSIEPLSMKTIGSLNWKSLKIEGEGGGPVTESRVWTAPRAAKSASVISASGEREQFLFYRGLGHIESPVRVTQPNGKISVSVPNPSEKGDFEWAWAYERKADGRCDQHAERTRINYANGDAEMERAPERPDDFETDTLSAITRRLHELRGSW